jgi:hypothetical protein
MHHIDEHTLELYALKADEITGKVDEIEDHLRECHGCRALVEEMQGYYSDLDEELKQPSAPEVSTETAIARRQMHLRPHYEPFAPPMRYQPNTPLARMFYFARRHPVPIMLSSFAIVGLLGWFLNDAIRLFSPEKKITDLNPTSYYLNTATGFLEIRNKEDQKLWEMASNKLDGALKNEEEINIKTTIITDLDNDGKNEILTILPPVGAETDKRNSLRIYSSDKKLIREIPFGRPIKYKDTQYLNTFSSEGLIVDNFGADKKQIIVFSRNDRSPIVISRLNADGKNLGEYWHFGHIMGMYALDVTGNGRKEIVICGFNDVLDNDHKEFPMIAVLNPMNINGETESLSTPGFGLSKSEAELFYIQLPRTDLDNVLQLTPGVQGLMGSDENSLKFTTMTKMTNGEVYYFDYVFTRELKLLLVKSVNTTDQLRNKLVQEGKLIGTIDQYYLDSLKKGIHYWDGKEWRKEWTMVKHLP